jgi:hypothetical protein
VKIEKKLEKKLVAFSVFAFIMGIAVILPLYLTLGIGVAVQAESVCDPFVYSVAVYPDSTIFQEGYGDSAFIVLDDAFGIHSISNSKQVDAKIQVYNYHFYSDQSSIANITHTIAITKDVSDPDSPSGLTSAIIDRSKEKNTYTFADGTIFDITEAIGYVEGNRLSGIIYDQGSTEDLYSMHDVILLSGSNGERSAQALSNARNAQKIYVDITMILSVTYKHSNSPSASSIITTTLTSSKVLFHAELTKMDDGSFRYTTEKTNTSNNNTPVTPDISDPPPDDSNFPPNIIKLPPGTFQQVPAAMTLSTKLLAANVVIQKLAA